MNCDRAGARAVIDAALAAGATPAQMVLEIIQPALDAMGALWAAGEVALTQIFVASRGMEEAADAMAGGASAPQSAEHRRPRPKVVLGGLDGHGLGARLVGTFLRAAGAEVVEVGRLSPEELSARAIEERADVVAVSVLMLHSAERVREVRQALDRLGAKVKVVAGGAPFRADPGLAARVGVDAWAPDALQAVAAILAAAASGGGGEGA